jgi:hypothetical protein
MPNLIEWTNETSIGKSVAEEVLGRKSHWQFLRNATRAMFIIMEP